MPTSSGTSRQNGETLASSLFEAVKRDIIQGHFKPGAKLRVRSLAERFGTGLSPVREALNRLSSDGFVQQNDLRGFSVAATSEQDLVELTKARCWINERALREAIEHGDAAWEEGLVIAYHRLSRIDSRTRSGESVDEQARETVHRQFHHSLIAGCGSRWIVDICEQLFDASERYRHLSRLAPDATGRCRDDEHHAIMEAAIARKADEAADLLTAHFWRTTELCRGSLIAPAPPGDGNERA
jgi:DNA-binding GntR family transcriptional regulator